MTAVKICGLSTRAGVDAAVTAGADYIGFVFFAASPRDVAVEQALALGRDVPRRLARVGVFVGPNDALLDRAAPAIDAIQVHGDLAPGRVAAIRDRYRLPVWRAAAVATRDDIAAAVAQREGAAVLLFDAKPPTGSPLPGGNGIRFDWRLLGGGTYGGAWGLSGGLDAASVADAVRLTGAPLVDVSSGVEEAPGVKSVNKINAFVAAAKAA